MQPIDIPLDKTRFQTGSKALEVLEEAEALRGEALALKAEGRIHDAMERTVAALRRLRDFPDYRDTDFRALFATILFDLAGIHFELKNYRRCEKELDVLFNVLDSLVRQDSERFGKFHILALELSARLLRSAKKTLSLIVRAQMNASALYEKVNSGVAEAAGSLAATLAEIGRLQAAAGKEDQAVKFLAEALKFSKKQNGKVTCAEIALTVEMAEIMMRSRELRASARRLLEAALPRAIDLALTSLERDILALLETIDSDADSEPAWKSFMAKVAGMVSFGSKAEPEPAEAKTRM